VTFDQKLRERSFLKQQMEDMTMRLPPKALFNSKDDQIIDKRRKALQTYLQSVSLLIPTQKHLGSDLLLAFLDFHKQRRFQFSPGPSPFEKGAKNSNDTTGRQYLASIKSSDEVSSSQTDTSGGVLSYDHSSNGKGVIVPVVAKQKKSCVDINTGNTALRDRTERSGGNCIINSNNSSGGGSKQCHCYCCCRK
jgi:hypothetical protein